LLVAFGLGLGGALASPPAAATEIRTVSRTVGEGYMVLVPGADQQLLSRRRLVQYVNLGVYDLLPAPLGELRRPYEDGQLRIVTSMRLRHDFGTFLRPGDDQAANLLQSVDGRQIDLMYGYLEGERLGGHIDLRLGRQFEMSGLDFYALDGGWVRGHTPAYLAFEVFGGFEVKSAQTLGYPTFELDGTQGTAADRGYSPIIGAAVAADDVEWLEARLAWRRTWSSPPLNTQLNDDDGTPGLPGGIEQDILSLSTALRVLEGRFSPHAALRYDLGRARLTDLSAGAQIALSDRHTVRALVLRASPRFDLDSIFNVFSFQPINDARLVYEVKLGSRWTVGARGQGRLLVDDFPGEGTGDSASDGSSESARATTFRPGYGGGLSAYYRIPRFAMRLDGYGLGGEGGIRAGGSVDTRTMVAWNRLGLDGRVYGNYYKDDVSGAREGYALALQGGFNAELFRGVHLAVLGEELLTSYYKHAFRLLATFSVDWTIRGRQR
ncbi:MAG: hypothetical protein KC468_35315, partial [Myxococcales bacterium]|nr:hypothetical protein [Myxococcales bacterium]